MSDLLNMHRRALSALLGYLFPLFAMLAGAGLGDLLKGSAGATALGAIAGFLGALAVVRLAIDLMPGLVPSPSLIPRSEQSPHFRQEQCHD